MRRLTRIGISCLIWFAAVMPSRAEAPAQAAENPPAVEWGKVLTAGVLMVGTVALTPWDKGIQEDVPHFQRISFIRGNDLSSWGRAGHVEEQLGGPVGVLGVGGAFYVTGAVAGSPKARQTGLLVAESYFVNGVLVLGLKEVVGRSRPVNAGVHDSDDFKFLSGQASFPSGHTSTAFAMATIISDQYRSPWVGLAAYGTATLVGAGRVMQNQHWTSDVVAGACLGYISAKLTDGLEAKTGWTLAIANKGRGVALEKRFR